MHGYVAQHTGSTDHRTTPVLYMSLLLLIVLLMLGSPSESLHACSVYVCRGPMNIAPNKHYYCRYMTRGFPNGTQQR